MREIRLRGARTNNLRGLDLDIAPGTLLVLAGPSGSGKSSLAFGTLYAEGRRRYVESFSAYARQFLERLKRPPVQSLDPVPAAVAVDRQSPVKSSRATVGTLTEITGYARELWSVSAVLHCPTCGNRIEPDTPASAAERLLGEAGGRRAVVTYEVPVQDAEHFLSVREALVGEGYRRVWHGRQVHDLDRVPPSRVLTERATAGGRRGEAGRATLQVVVDRTAIEPGERHRLAEAIETSFERGGGAARVWLDKGDYRFSRQLHCPTCNRDFHRPTLGAFSFNNPLGACDSCRGFGRTIEIDWDKVIPDWSKSLEQGAIKAWSGKAAARERRKLLRHCVEEGVPVDRPYAELNAEQRRFIIEGDGGRGRQRWYGLRRWFKWIEKKSYKMHVRVFLARYRKYETCPSCQGARLKPEALWWRIEGRSLADFYSLSIDHALSFLLRIDGEGRYQAARPLLDACRDRLTTLCRVGLPYLTLDRAARTLSGGELQRVSLVSALGASLTDALFVLDEPTVGLHPADVRRLLPVVQSLKAGGNAVVVVEHDPVFLRGADRVVRLGPGAGARGGRIVFDGPPDRLDGSDVTWCAALGARPAQRRRRRAASGRLVLRGARGHNLKGIDLDLPLGVLTCVTGVSGSGKSTLLLETLLPAMARDRGDLSHPALPFDSLQGQRAVSDFLAVDQSPLGRTSRGNPATYLGAWQVLRKRLAATPLARQRGWGPGMFSFNTAGGRCEACRGEGSETVEMQFLADVTFTCPECGGRRFTPSLLEVRLRGKSAADLLELTVDEALELFADDRELSAALGPLGEVGAGYLTLGQPLNTLSGGEAQRLKLAAALGKVGRRALLVLDEPTAGLAACDLEPLLSSLDRLVQRGNTVVVIEHDMMVAAAADHVIDLGPGAGERGGRIAAQGTPEQVAGATESRTAPFLAAELALRAEAPVLASATPTGGAEGDPVIEVCGAREHNLKNIEVRVPRDRLVVVTGPSGSGKSTLVFDTIFAEGQRRYLESLSPYARQYLPLLPRPAADRVSGVPPAMSLGQRSAAGAFNSTVATLTEIAHYLRLLFARVGLLRCPTCGEPIAARQPGALATDVRRRFGERTVAVLAPVVRAAKGTHRELLDRALTGGIARARIDGRWVSLEPGLGLERYREHDVELLVGRQSAGSQALGPLIERALELGGGAVTIRSGKQQLLLGSKRACPRCGSGFPELDPRLFSFNTRQGACPTCEGAGFVQVTAGRGRHAQSQREICPECEGGRLGGLGLHVTVAGHTISDLLALGVEQARKRIRSLRLTGSDRILGEPLLREIEARLVFLSRVGLDYLSLDRAAWTLSSGELQRVRLTSQLGSGLTGILYVLDEPTIGLHPRDTGKLLDALTGLVEQGCSVLVAEHDADTIRAADHLIDMGPGGGSEGGRVLASGPPDSVLSSPSSVTGRSLGGPPPLGAGRRVARGARRLVLRGASEHNLRIPRVAIPLGRLVAVTGVSGSGKSTLVRQTLLRAARRALGLQSDPPGAFEAIEGAEHLRRAVEVDQQPIGRTPRSVPATYVGVWDEIRKLLAATPAARARGYTASRFSFNVEGGRCPACAGQGVIATEMSFLPQVFSPCEACDGLRYGPETLEVALHGLNAGQLLGLTVDQAAELFRAVPAVRGPLGLLSDLGLGYLTLGQPSNTLSGGEAQRLKLVAEMGLSTASGTLYVMDEPTTGLHREDVRRLLAVLDRMVERGDSVLVIEHHPDVILAADWVIDLGPEGGTRGGRIVAQGPPQKIMRSKTSHTGAALRRPG